MTHVCDKDCAHTISVGPVWVKGDDGRWTSFCVHCLDETDRDDDPAPDLCVMCEKAGRTSRG